MAGYYKKETSVETEVVTITKITEKTHTSTNIMNKNKKIKLLTYNCSVVFIITDELKAIVNNIYKKLKHPDTFSEEAEGVVVTIDIDNYYVVLDTHYLSHNTIGHELYHAVVKVTEDRDIVDEESQAWLMGYLSQEMYKFINKNSFTIVN